MLKKDKKNESLSDTKGNRKRHPNPKIRLNELEKKRLNIDFEGDVYCCEWGELPSYLKSKTKINERNLIVPQEIAAKIYTKIGVFDLYNIDEAKKKGEYDSFRITPHQLTFKEWVNNPDEYVVLDTETTGFAKCDEVIQLSIVDMNNKILFNSYFKPTVESHPRALEVHKLTNQFLADKPKFSEKWEEIAKLLENKIIIIHNEMFDIRLLNQTCERYGIKTNINLNTCCSMRYFEREMGISKLENILKELSLIKDGKELHNSLIDCQMLVKALNENDGI